MDNGVGIIEDFKEIDRLTKKADLPTLTGFDAPPPLPPLDDGKGYRVTVWIGDEEDDADERVVKATDHKFWPAAKCMAVRYLTELEDKQIEEMEDEGVQAYEGPLTDLHRAFRQDIRKVLDTSVDMLPRTINLWGGSLLIERI